MKDTSFQFLLKHFTKGKSIKRAGIRKGLQGIPASNMWTGEEKLSKVYSSETGCYGLNVCVPSINWNPNCQCDSIWTGCQDGICVLKEKEKRPKYALFYNHVNIVRRRPPASQGETSPGTDSAGTLILAFPASRTMRNEMLFKLANVWCSVTEVWAETLVNSQTRRRKYTRIC